MNESNAPASMLRSLDSGDLIEIVLIIAIAIALVVIAETVVPRIAARLGARAKASMLPWIPVFRLLVLTLTIMVLVPMVVEPGTDGFLGLVGAGAVALGFAFKDYLTSILAGVVVLFERSYRQGDWVRVGDVYGEVREMGMRALRIATPDDDLVTVPHGYIWNSMVHNANDGGSTLQCVADFYVDPAHDARQLNEALADAALSSPWIDVSRPIAVVVREQPWATHYRVRAYPIAAEDQFRFVTDMTIRGKRLLADLGARPAAAARCIAAS